jgi:ParB-like nuclease domain
MAAFGVLAPVLVDETFTLIGGNGRLAAAKSLELTNIPAVRIRGLSAAPKCALALADNKTGENAGWDHERLAIELPELADLLLKEDLDISLTGFSPAEFDQLQIDFEQDSADPEDDINQGWLTGPAISKRGRQWILNQHRLICGSARDPSDLDRLMGSVRATANYFSTWLGSIKNGSQVWPSRSSNVR